MSYCSNLLSDFLATGQSLVYFFFAYYYFCTIYQLTNTFLHLLVLSIFDRCRVCSPDLLHLYC